MMAQLPDYDEIAECLNDPGIGVAAAEAHGTLCGLLCTAAQDLPGAWIGNTLADANDQPRQVPVDAYQKLELLYRESLAALDGADMAFCPLLPADDCDLTTRTAALAVWCQGFLYGLAVRGLRDLTDLAGETREFLEDLVQISHAELDAAAAEASEQDELAYAELVEYIRVGVQLFFETANPVLDPAAPPDHH